MQRTIFEPEHDAFRAAVRSFVAKEVAPHIMEWEAAGIVDRELFSGLRRTGSSAPTSPRSSAAAGSRTSATTRSCQRSCKPSEPPV
jgi:long-chain-acyl-CoA dehydrogenase